jgi:hypothetical protein
MNKVYNIIRFYDNGIKILATRSTYEKAENFAKKYLSKLVIEVYISIMESWTNKEPVEDWDKD